MSDLVVIGFDNEFKADEVLLALRKLQREHLVDLEDGCVVIRKPDGKLKLKQSYNLVAAGAAGGGFWGLLVGLLFMNPLIGVLAGAAAGALGGALSDIGIEDDFIRELGQTIQPGTSALFVLVRKVTMDKVLDDLRMHGGKVLHTSLSHEDEAKLEAALAAKVPAASASGSAPVASH